MIYSGYQFRKELGAEVVQAVLAHDDYRRRRARTRRTRSKLIAHFGRSCAYCGSTRRPEAAHLIPLELGAGSGEANVVILCRHCHLAFDAGHVSIRDMLDVAAMWKRGHPRAGDAVVERPPLVASITPPPQEIVDVINEASRLQRKGRCVRALAVVAEGLEGRRLPERARIFLLIKRAELHRRRSAAAAVPNALAILERLAEDEAVPESLASLFNYELQMAYRLDGQQAKALTVARKSLRAAKLMEGPKPGTALVAAGLNVVLCEVATQRELDVERADVHAREIQRLISLARGEGGYWGAIWTRNGLARLSQLWLKAGAPDRAREAFTEYEELYLRSDTTTGWDMAERNRVSMMDGLIRVLDREASEEDLRHGVRLLSRSLRSRFGGRQRLEGVRDVGYGIATGLGRLPGPGNEELSHTLGAVLSKVVDGTSVVWPYVRDVPANGTA